MRSTLPALFRQTSSADAKKRRSPAKQGPFYDLNLTISHNSYRTKIINPHQAKQYTDDLSRSTHLKPLIGRYGNRHKRFVSLGIGTQSNQGEAIQSHSHHRLSQIDNVKFNLGRVQTEADQLAQRVNEAPQMNQSLLMQIKESEKKLHSEIDNINEQWQAEISKLRERMSLLRRQTKMEQKLFKKQLGDINDQLLDCINVIKSIEEHRATLRRLNF